MSKEISPHRICVANDKQDMMMASVRKESESAMRSKGSVEHHKEQTDEVARTYEKKGLMGARTRTDMCPD